MNIKSIILIFGIMILQSNFSCKSELSTRELKNNFTTEQISDLNKIIDFFKNQICQNNDSDFKTCFSEVLPKLLEYGWQPILEKVDFGNKKNYINLFPKLHLKKYGCSEKQLIQKLD